MEELLSQIKKALESNLYLVALQSTLTLPDICSGLTNENGKSDRNDYIKWYADYQEKPLYPYDFDIWQYTSSGKVHGIQGNVDLNIQMISK